jgi:hypothetical protein
MHTPFSRYVRVTSKKFEEKWGCGEFRVLGEKCGKRGKWGAGGGWWWCREADSGAVVVGEMMGGDGVWIIGRLDEEG